MSEQTEPKIVEPEIIYVFGNPVKMSISREHCLEALRQLMLAETYPELTKVKGGYGSPHEKSTKIIRLIQ